MPKTSLPRLSLLLIPVLLGLHCTSTRKEPGRKTQHPQLEMKPIPAGVGVNIHFFEGNQQDWAMLERAHVGMVRMDVGWAAGEPSPGRYDFARYDTLVSRLERRNMRLLFILDYGNPHYGNGPPTSDSALQASVHFTSALARHFAGHNVIWELWNEPNLARFWPPKPQVDAYMRWCKAVVPAIRKQDPGACIVGPAVSSIDLAFLEACFKRGYLELVDGVSVHPYRGSDRGPETVLPEYEDLRLLIAAYAPQGKRIPIVSGEWGYSTTWMSRAQQGKFLPRQWLVNLSAGIPISIWYDWHDDGQNPDDPEHNFGTVTWDYRPKPAYRAMQSLTHELEKAKLAGRLPLASPNDFVLVFQAPDSTARVVLWTTDSPHDLDLGRDLHVRRAVDHLGNPLDASPSRFSELQLDDSPLYLTVVPPWPDWISLLFAANQLTDNEAVNVLRGLAKSEGYGKLSRFGRRLVAARQHEDPLLRHVAWSVVVDLLERVKPDRETSVAVARRILESDVPGFEKARVVDLLAQRAPLRAYPLVRGLPEDPALDRARATLSYQVAYALAKKGQTKKAEKALLAGLRGSGQRHFAQRVVDLLAEQDSSFSPKITRFATRAGFFTHWWIGGPFPKQPETRFFPERRFDTTDVRNTPLGQARWQEVVATNLWGLVDFGEIYGKVPGVAYARAELIAPAAFSGGLKIGSNDGVVVFVNGKEIFRNLVARGLTVDQDWVPITLRKGPNTLLFKVVNEGANWQVCVRLCDKEGRGVDLSNFSRAEPKPRHRGVP